MSTDPRLQTFCSHQGLDVFHSITHQNQIWKPDPYDVESIHEAGRAAYERLLHRIDGRTASDSGRILLLLGESGAGKTHLMRAFRNQTHEHQKGFFSYMQMTSAVSNYARYVLRNTIDSFDKPYYEPFGASTGLIKLSNALAEDAAAVSANELAQLREGELAQDALVDLIYPIADRIVTLERFQGIDIDLIRALLYLQLGQPAVNAKIFKLIRCEPLTPYDSKVLGGISSRAQEDDPLRMLQSLARLIQAVTDGAFVVCLDQLEDIHGMDEAAQRFRRAIQAIVTLAEIPNVIVVLSCLGEFYAILQQNLPKSHIDRLELDPIPVRLTAEREEVEVEQIISRRLQYLYELTDTPVEDADSIYPFPEPAIQTLANLTTRDVLEWCRRRREESIETGKEPTLCDDGDESGIIDTSKLSQFWSDHLTKSVALPEADHDFLYLIGQSIERCGQELGNGYQFTTEPANGYLRAKIEADPENVSEALLLAMCQKRPQGGALARQIRTLEEETGDHTPVVLRTTEFPSNPKTKVAQQIGQFISNGGRRAQVADSDWRAMMAMQSFEEQYGNRPEYSAWLQAEQPLSQLPSLQHILDLKNLQTTFPAKTNPGSQTTARPTGGEFTQTSRATTANGSVNGTHGRNTISGLSKLTADILLGQTRTALPTPVELPQESLVRHAAFLGGSGSGKTTLALTLIEQLLLRGIPAILLDRKGDLCSYANPAAWEQITSKPTLTAARQQLRAQIDVAVYTPGTIGTQGRPLSIAVTPPGLDQLPSAERQQIANYCATALGGVMGYKTSGLDKTRIAILGQAIAVLSDLQTEDSLSIDQLIEFIADQDPLLVNAIGALDPKHCKKLAEDLQTLSLMTGYLFDTEQEQLSVEQLLGTNKPQTSQPQKTPLSIINLGSLGDNANILFWVSQFLLDLNRYAQKNPSSKLQAVVLFDEADLYLPAVGKPSTKEPMESLLKRARSAGLGILLATQSPGDLDYKSRDQISSWFVGKVKENTALNKLKPMLSEAKVDVTNKLANQQVGEFYAIQAGEVTPLQAKMSLIRAEQVPIERIQALALKSAGV